MRLGEGRVDREDIQVIPTGSLGLDIALGIGGCPRGRIVEIYGPESSGKTTLTLHAIAEVQKRGRRRARSSTPSTRSTSATRKKLGVKTDELLVSPARLRRAGARDRRHAGALGRGRHRRRRLGRGARCPRPRSRARWATRHVGLQARLMSQALRKLTGTIAKSQHAWSSSSTRSA